MTVELSIAAIASGGEGVGRDDDGRVTFVPRSALGDRLRVAIHQQRKSYARGAIDEILEPSAVRTKPECPLFEDARCGGCQWQHMTQAAQVEAKAAIVARELRALEAEGMEIRPMIAPVSAYKWRRRARLHYARIHGHKSAIIGFHGARDRRITDVARCPQLVPALNDALAIVREHLAPHLGSRGHIDMLAGHDGHVHLAITGFCSPRWAQKLVGKAGVHGTIIGVGLYPPARARDKLERKGRADDIEQAGAQPMEWGKRAIPLEPGFKGRADLFAQASLDGNRALLKAVDDACGPRTGKRILEFFAGSGNLTRILERDALAVLSTDSRRVRWMRGMVCGDADAVADDLIEDGQYYDTIVLDPPRTGALSLMHALLDLHPETLVYVSCDPATLARDLAVLTAGGYRAEYAQPIDLMPQTAHVEVVVRLMAPR